MGSPNKVATRKSASSSSANNERSARRPVIALMCLVAIIGELSWLVYSTMMSDCQLDRRFFENISFEELSKNERTASEQRMKQPVMMGDEEKDDSNFGALKQIQQKQLSGPEMSFQEYSQQTPSNNEYISRFPMKQERYNSKARFLFVVGLEGTGHHIVLSILNQSPLKTTLTNMSIYPNSLEQLIDTLHNDLTGSLFNIHCSTNIGHGDGIDNSNWQGLMAKHDDMDQYVDHVAEVLRTIEGLSNNATNVTTTTTSLETTTKEQITVPINGWEFSRSGILSYPNNRGQCRRHKYPNLDLLYQACEKAQVDCVHAMAYRNPYAVLKSNVIKRKFEPTTLGAVVLYSNMLQVIWTQLLMHPTKTVGCLGFFESDDQDMIRHWRRTVRKEFGWSMDPSFDDEFNQLMTKTVRKDSTTWTAEARAAVIPKKYQVAMDAYVRLHESVVALCYQQYEQNK